MEDILLGIVLGLLITVPPAIKWELPMGQVMPAGFVIGLLSGAAVHVLSLFIGMGPAARLLSTASLIILFAGSALLARFYRDPERTPPDADNCIISPADGIVRYVRAMDKDVVPFSSKGGENVRPVPGLLGILPEGKGRLVGIAMNFLDVHVTRAPIGGKVAFMEHVPGSFLSLKRPDAVHRNERLHQVIENGNYRVGVIHIASRLVRQIVPFVGTGELLAAGQRIGMIKFGSQVDVVLPDYGNLEIRVGPGDKVVAGETVIAVLKTVQLEERRC